MGCSDKFIDCGWRRLREGIQFQWNAEDAGRAIQGIVEEEGETLNGYTIEKNNLKRLLTGSSMIEISYGEVFRLLFEQRFDRDGTEEKPFLALLIDAPCWFGDREEWTAKAGIPGSKKEAGEREDCLLAYELARLRYNNLIRVENVEFLDDYMAITFEGENILSIAYCHESDYAWLLEEVSSKAEQERLSICCQGDELFQNNIGNRESE